MSSISLPALAGSFPLVETTMSLITPAALSQDVNTLWTTAYSGPMGRLTSAMAAGDTTFVISTPALQALLGSTVLLDNEPMIVTAVSADGLTYTVTRFLDAFPFMSHLPMQPVSAHPVGTAVNLLTYATPFMFLFMKYVQPNLQNDIRGLGPNSLSFAFSISGSVAPYTAPAAA